MEPKKTEIGDESKEITCKASEILNSKLAESIDELDTLQQNILSDVQDMLDAMLEKIENETFQPLVEALAKFKDDFLAVKDDLCELEESASKANCDDLLSIKEDLVKITDKISTKCDPENVDASLENPAADDIGTEDKDKSRTPRRGK